MVDAGYVKGPPCRLWREVFIGEERASSSCFVSGGVVGVAIFVRTCVSDSACEVTVVLIDMAILKPW